jgi:hypothetical protein
MPPLKAIVILRLLQQPDTVHCDSANDLFKSNGQLLNHGE